MPALARQRCLHHSTREAVARCPECGEFYCRECITEHDGKVICASCLKKLAAQSAVSPRRINFWPVLQGAGGLIVAWFIFYSVGRFLISIPDEAHETALWSGRWLDQFESGRHE